MDYDVVIVGAGPAGLATAIRLKTAAASKGFDVSVVVVEKGSQVGSHILSGAVIDPSGLDALIPEWRDDAPLKTTVSDDQFFLLGEQRGARLPHWLMPPLMSNRGNYIGSLGQICGWLAEKAEGIGVEIYPQFAAAEILYDETGAVCGIATGDMGISRGGKRKPKFERGMELRGRYTVFAEGARGHLAKQVIARFGLDSNCEPAKFSIGLKELWRVKSDRHIPGLVQHAFGWPLGNRNGGGAFLYHFDDEQVAVGFVVHLDYANPYISPFDEFQRFKTHPLFRETFEGGKRLSYGARAIAGGGWQSVPRLSFPGGVLVGCAAGFVNLPRIKGSHNAILSGVLAADHLINALMGGRSRDELASYEQTWRVSAIGQDLRKVRNVKPLWSRLGLYLGIPMGGFDMWCNTFGFSLFGTLKHGKSDAATLRPASEFQPIHYPKPDGVLTFDKLSSVFLSNTNHEEDQPMHLKVGNMSLQERSEYSLYAGPSTRYCPAGVYEWLVEKAGPRLQINAQNCIHCKTCDVKDPNGNIEWTAPEGGGGPNYAGM